MKILAIAPFNLPVPSFEGYGGTQRIIHDIIDGLSSTDKITLMAPEGSSVREGVRQLTYSSKNAATCVEEIMLHLEKEKESYDLVYSHLSSPEIAEKIINSGNRLVVASYYYFENDKLQRFSQLDCYVQSLSYSHADFLQRHLEKVISVKYSMSSDGIQPSLVPLSLADPAAISLDILHKLKKQARDYFLIVSRISNYKGQATAIRLAREVGEPLIIAGTPVIETEGDFAYFHKKVEPQIDNKDIFYFGNASEKQRNELMRFAKATILPTGFENSQWHEAYGRVVNESLACGTPVVATDRDAMPEQIENGRSGFLFTNYEEALTACRQVDAINREDCLKRIKTHLNLDRFLKELRPALIKAAGS